MHREVTLIMIYSPVKWQSKRIWEKSNWTFQSIASFPHTRLLKCPPWWQRRCRRAVSRRPNGPFRGGGGSFSRSWQVCACGSNCSSAKSTCSQTGKDRVHGRSHQAAGGRDSQKDQVSVPIGTIEENKQLYFYDVDVLIYWCNEWWHYSWRTDASTSEGSSMTRVTQKIYWLTVK